MIFLLRNRVLLKLTGSGVEDLLNGIMSSNIKSLECGNGHNSTILSSNGKLLLDCFVYKISETEFLIDIDSNLEKILIDKLETYKFLSIFDIKKESEFSIFAIVPYISKKLHYNNKSKDLMQTGGHFISQNNYELSSSISSSEQVAFASTSQLNAKNHILKEFQNKSYLPLDLNIRKDCSVGENNNNQQLIQNVINNIEKEFSLINIPTKINANSIKNREVILLRDNRTYAIEIWRVYCKHNKLNNNVVQEKDLLTTDNYLNNNSTIWNVNNKTTHEKMYFENHFADLLIQIGVVDGKNFESGKNFPILIGMKEQNGISITKGCYIGQENVMMTFRKPTSKKVFRAKISNKYTNLLSKQSNNEQQNKEETFNLYDALYIFSKLECPNIWAISIFPRFKTSVDVYDIDSVICNDFVFVEELINGADIFCISIYDEKGNKNNLQIDCIESNNINSPTHETIKEVKKDKIGKILSISSDCLYAIIQIDVNKVCIT